MKYGVVFATVAMLLAILAIVQQGWRLLLLWPAFSFAVVSLGYLHFGPRVFGKSSRGRLSSLMQLVLMPFLVCLWTVWHTARIVKREPAVSRLTDNILIGRRLLSHELPDDVEHVVDLTCEFNEPRKLRSLSYFSFQILDGFVPSVERLREWTDCVAQLPGTVYIHCAEGHGRTGLLAACLLLRLGHSRTPDEALRYIQSRRPHVRLARVQLAALNAFYDHFTTSP